jgi:hypothetical protein
MRPRAWHVARIVVGPTPEVPMFPRVTLIVLSVTFAFASSALAAPRDVIFTPELEWVRLGDALLYGLPQQSGSVVVGRMEPSWFKEFGRDCKRSGKLTVIDDDTHLCELTLQTKGTTMWMMSLAKRIPGERDAVSLVVMSPSPRAAQKTRVRTFMHERAPHCFRFIDLAPGETEGDVFAGESVERCAARAAEPEKPTLDEGTFAGLDENQRALMRVHHENGRFTARAQAWEQALKDKELKVTLSSSHESYGKFYDGTSNSTGDSSKLFLNLCAHGGGAMYVEDFMYASSGLSSTSTSEPKSLLWFVGDDERTVTLFTFFDGAWHRDSLGSDYPRQRIQVDGKRTSTKRSAACTD